jgi:hypothetical protein
MFADWNFQLNLGQNIHFKILQELKNGKICWQTSIAQAHYLEDQEQE